ncbi:MAG: helix-turn-helix domain-containing protein [Anaerocolumna sp.]
MKTEIKESKVHLKVSISIIMCVVIAIVITSSILYVNFQSILMKHEYEINLEKMESEDEQRLKLANIALNTLYQIYNDISVTKLLTYETVSGVEESTAFLQLRHFLVTIPDVDSIYLYNSKNDRIYNVTNETDLIKPWRAEYDTIENFHDSTAVTMIENYKDYIPFIMVPRYYQVNQQTKKIVYTYIMYDVFKNSKKRNVIMLNLEPEYLFPEKNTEYPSTVSLVLDENGKVIYSNSSDFEVLDNLKELLNYDNSISKKKSGYFLEEISGNKSVIIFTDTNKFGWRNISIIDYNDLLSQVKKLQSTIIIITLMIAGVGVVVAFLCSYRLVSPIRVMTKDINNLLLEKRRTETLTRSIKIKELLENIGFESGGRYKTGAELLSLLGMSLAKNQKLVLLCMKVDDYQYLLESSDTQLINAYKFAAVNILNELMQNDSNTYCLNLSLDKNLLFYILEGEDETRRFEENLIHTQRLVQEYFQTSISIAISEYTQDLDKLFIQYKQIEEALSRSIFWEKSSIVFCDQIKIKDLQNYKFPENKEKQLMKYLTNGKAKEAHDIYLEIITQTYSYPIVIYNMVISRLIFMINNAVNLIQKNSSFHTFASSIIFTNLLQDCNTIKERNEKLLELFMIIQKEMENKRKDKLSQTIMDIHFLIEKQFQNPLFSIEMLADEIGISSAYMCRIYKQYTGNTINDTLLDKRMEQARLLLNESALSVNEIAEKVGFNGSTYFYRVFKKLNGVTPNEYRRK